MWVSLDPRRAIIYQTYFKKNLLELNDDIFGFFSSQVQDQADVVNGPGEGIYFGQDFKLDKEYDVYQRQVYSLSGVLQDIGGFYNSLFFVGLLLYSNFQETLFFTSIISKLFMVEQPSQDQTTINRQQGKGENTTFEESMRRQVSVISPGKFTARKKVQKGCDFSDLERNQSVTRIHVKKALIKDVQEQDQPQVTTLNQRTVQTVLRYLQQNRSFLRFTGLEILYITIKDALSPILRHFYKSTASDPPTKHNYYKEGERKVMQELDCVSFLSRMRNLELMMELMLSKKQKMLMPLQIKGNVIGQHTPHPLKSSKINLQETVSKLNAELTDLEHSEMDMKLLYGIISHDPEKLLDLQKQNSIPNYSSRYPLTSGPSMYHPKDQTQNLSYTLDRTDGLMNCSHFYNEHHQKATNSIFDNPSNEFSDNYCITGKSTHKGKQPKRETFTKLRQCHQLQEEDAQPRSRNANCQHGILVVDEASQQVKRKPKKKPAWSKVASLPKPKQTNHDVTLDQSVEISEAQSADRDQ
ncbi:hypothetical protein FGO68_gene7187 [Halteria grandinella]|uniref:Uncharacterized protein n=1 Tax=Halteria grandinella TaxID=5974 RepID=A0A8J8T5C7_HALGN|nr:hypothetical protein FGO68_gene7187 [Halteria grandinella]